MNTVAGWRQIIQQAACTGMVLALSGCASFESMKNRISPKKDPVPESGVVQTSFTDERKPTPLQEETLLAAEEAYRREDLEKAESLFHKVAEDTTIDVRLAEKARFFEAECIRQQGYLPRAADTYHKLLITFEGGVYRSQAAQRMFEIADYWLEDTREQMKMELERAEGKRWFVPSNLVHWDRKKPLVDEEGRALELLEKAHYNDPTGPTADKALYLAGYVHFYRGNFKEADVLLSQLVDMYPKSPLRPQALELAVIAKNNSTGGPDYDGRPSAEAMKLIQGAKSSMPELANRGDFLDRQMVGIRTQQADKDMAVAEFYRRTGHPGSAYFYYELVKRRYPNSKQAEVANQNMAELRLELENSKNPDLFEQSKRGFKKYVLGLQSATLQPGQEVPQSQPSSNLKNFTPAMPQYIDSKSQNKPTVPNDLNPNR